MTAEELETIKERWVPYAYLSRLPGDREDVQALILHIQMQAQHLSECHAFLLGVVGSARPIPGGLQREALEILEAQGAAWRGRAGQGWARNFRKPT